MHISITSIRRIGTKECQCQWEVAATWPSVNRIVLMLRVARWLGSNIPWLLKQWCNFIPKVAAAPPAACKPDEITDHWRRPALQLLATWRSGRVVWILLSKIQLMISIDHTTVKTRSSSKSWRRPCSPISAWSINRAKARIITCCFVGSRSAVAWNRRIVQKWHTAYVSALTKALTIIYNINPLSIPFLFKYRKCSTRAIK